MGTYTVLGDGDADRRILEICVTHLSLPLRRALRVERRLPGLGSAVASQPERIKVVVRVELDGRAVSGLRDVDGASDGTPTFPVLWAFTFGAIGDCELKDWKDRSSSMVDMGCVASYWPSGAKMST